MRTHLLAPSLLAASVTLAAAGAQAHAGSYLSAGLGGAARLDGALSENFDTGGHDSARISLGQRIGPIALEASYFGADLSGTNRFTSTSDWTSRTLGLDLKFHLGILG